MNNKFIKVCIHVMLNNNDAFHIGMDIIDDAWEVLTTVVFGRVTT